MNNISYSILTKEKMEIGDDGIIPGNIFCTVCNVHMNRIKRSQPLDIHQQCNAFTLDRIKKQVYPIDRLQTLHTNSHKKVDHSKETLLKLNPYLILDTDPTLDNLNYSSALSRSSHSLGKYF